MSLVLAGFLRYWHVVDVFAIGVLEPSRGRLGLFSYFQTVCRDMKLFEEVLSCSC